jgi:hypothetical protein
MRILVVAGGPVSAEALRAALPGEIDPAAAEVMVVAPALQDSRLRFWMSDADDAIARADEVARGTLQELEDGGIAASADTGESDPALAIEDALKSFAADRIILFAHPENEARYREQVDLTAIEDRFGIPVSQGDL